MALNSTFTNRTLIARFQSGYATINESSINHAPRYKVKGKYFVTSNGKTLEYTDRKDLTL